jgi:hypothetical protein
MGFLTDLVGALKQTPSKSLGVEECITALGWSIEEKEGNNIRFRPAGSDRQLTAIAIKPFLCLAFASSENVTGKPSSEVMMHLLSRNAVCTWKCVEADGLTGFGLYSYTHLDGVNPGSLKCFTLVMLDEMQEFETFIKQTKECGQNKAA